MNEELKILIRAVTTDAKKNLADVKKELASIESEGNSTKKAINEAMASAVKGAAAALAGVAALTAAMVTLGRSAQDVEKGFSKLKSSFTNAGSSAKEATKYYKELFGILGDHDRSVETGQSIARITTDPTALNDYKNIMAGAVSQYGEGYNSEALAENISETIASAQVVGDLERVLLEAGVSVDGFNAALQQTTSTEEREVVVRTTLNGLLGAAGQAYINANQATIAYNQSQANLNLTLADAARYTAPLMTELNNLSATLLTFFGPALQTVAVYLTAFIQLIIEAIQWVGGFFGMFSSSSERAAADTKGYQAAMNSYLGSLRNTFGSTNSELDKTNDKVKELKKQTMGFDELNVVSNPTTSSPSIGGGGGGGGSIGSLPIAPNPADFGIGSIDLGFEDMKKDIEEAKEKLEGILIIVGAIAAAFGLWKLTGFLTDLTSTLKIMKSLKGIDLDENWELLNKEQKEAALHAEKLKTQFKQIGGHLLIIVGAMAAWAGYSDAIENGVDWGNMILLIAAATAVVGGLALAYGKLAAQIGVIVAGIALMVVGVIDFIKNGPTMENTILILGGAVAGAVAVAVAAATMGVGPLVAAIIGVVAAVAAFTAAILLEEEAIMSVEDAQNALTEAKNRAAEAENSYINAVDAATAAHDRLKAAEEAAGISGQELYAQVQSGALDYANMSETQKELYKAYLDNEKKQADLKASTEEFNAAKKAETLAHYENELALAKESGNYDSYKQSVVDAFKSGELSADEARMMIEKSMSEMSDASQQTFMEDLPNDLKEGLDPNRYETTRKKIGDWFSNLWNSIKEGAVAAWDGTKKVFSAVGTWFKDIFTKAWEGVKNVFSTGGKIFDGIKEGIVSSFKTVVNAIIRGINKVVKMPFEGLNGVLNTISGLSIAGIKPFDWLTWRAPVPHLPELATGGIITADTVLRAGEGGKKEAILPLEQNTEWMDVLADRIAGRSSSPSKLVLMVDGKELGWASINGINGITRQTGNLPLELALV